MRCRCWQGGAASFGETEAMGVPARKTIFTVEEICALLGITREDLQFLVCSRHIGHRVAGESEARYLFDRNDLAVLAVLAAQMNRDGL